MISRSLIILISTILSNNLLGCTCGGYQEMEYEIKESKAVFVGTVVGRKIKTFSGKLESGENYKYKYYEYKIKVSEFFKGQKEKIIKVATAKEGATCGMNFKLFKKYVVYAQEDKRYGLFTTICHRNIRKSNRKFDRHIFRDEVKGLKKLKDRSWLSQSK